MLIESYICPDIQIVNFAFYFETGCIQTIDRVLKIFCQSFFWLINQFFQFDHILVASHDFGQFITAGHCKLFDCVTL